MSFIAGVAIGAGLVIGLVAGIVGGWYLLARASEGMGD
jgi:hypothetical protein